LPVDAVPGPSAAITGLMLSGLPTDRFSFEGFPPRTAGGRRKRLLQLAGDPRTLIFYESPRRVLGFLKEAGDVLGNRRVVVARELTKAHQEVIRGRLPELAAQMGDLRGEVVVVLEGAGETEAPDLEALAARVESLRTKGLSRKAAAARVATETGVSKRLLYETSLRRRTG
jgi:16S rRNA (cytidine1402-2'-O)-methyltransferase